MFTIRSLYPDVAGAALQVSMDGKGRYLDNIFVGGCGGASSGRGGSI